jgi:hypothetical protein
LQDSVQESEQKSVFVGEEDVEERSTPGKDLAAAIVIGALSVFAMVLALLLDVPVDFLTAPGLLPFITGFTLFCMVFGLGKQAAKRGGVQALREGRGKLLKSMVEGEEDRRLLMLIGIVVAYIVLVDVITFDLRFPTAIFTFHFSSFEFVSIPILTSVLKIFWKATWTRCLMVALPVIIALASVFRYGFKIPLPGAG